jgi:hypothetical protein
VLLAVVNLVIMTAGMFTRIIFPFMPAYGSPVRTVIAAGERIPTDDFHAGGMPLVFA